MQQAHAGGDTGTSSVETSETPYTTDMERIFAALAEEVAEHGYEQTTVAGVVERAGVSPLVFSELFSGKEDCFLQAYDAAIATVRRAIRQAYYDPRWPTLHERVRRGLAAVLDFCAAQPAVARMCVVEALAAGPRARARRDEAIRDLALFVEHLREQARGATAPSLVSEAIAGGISGILYTQILQGETRTLPDLLDELMDAGLRQLVEPDARG